MSRFSLRFIATLPASLRPASQIWCVYASRILCSLAVALLVSTAHADEPAEKSTTDGQISYFQQIRPIFQTHCQGCHQPAKPGGEYVMTDFATLVKGGESGDAAIMPGDVAKSFSIEQITPQEGAASMPKGKPPLAESELKLIATWIEQGAKDDTPESNRELFDMEHPPVYPAAPVINSVAFSPDGKLLAIAGYHEVLLHEVPEDATQSTSSSVDWSDSPNGSRKRLSRRMARSWPLVAASRGVVANCKSGTWRRRNCCCPFPWAMTRATAELVAGRQADFRR